MNETNESGRRRPVVFEPAAPFGIEMAAEMIQAGGLVAIPTDTVYGVASNWRSVEALGRIFTVKQRDRARTIPILVSSFDALSQHLGAPEDGVALLLDQYWPGALTVALPAPVGTPAPLVAADGTIGVRMPNHRLALELIEKAGGVIACTSANVSGHEAASSAKEVLASIGSEIDGIVNGGRAFGGVPSTVIGFAGDELLVYREGAILASDLQRVWREVRF